MSPILQESVADLLEQHTNILIVPNFVQCVLPSQTEEVCGRGRSSHYPRLEHRDQY